MQDLTGSNANQIVDTTAPRLDWLDGIRALAAGFVVLHHIWLMTYGGYPGNNGPWITDLLVYGHLAVSVFIVVSGFSLTLSPANHEMRLKGGAYNFLHRRFWRIVPPYWAALLISVIFILSGVIDSPDGSPLRGEDFIIHLLLMQDAIGNNSPNGVFWSIAVEWHIYFVFPFILLSIRKFGIAFTTLFVLFLVVVQYTAGYLIPALEALNRFSPVYLVLFTAGACAALLSHHGQAARTCVLAAVLLASGFVLTAILFRSTWIVSQYFWVDLAVGGAAAALMAALGQGSLPGVIRLLSTRPLVFTGQFSFSLYLVHGPVLEALRVHLLAPLGLAAPTAFWILAATGIPAALGFAYLFFLVCERPFLTIRSFRQLVAAVRGGMRQCAGYGFRSISNLRIMGRRI